MIIARVILFVNGLLHLYFGAVFIVSPEPLMAQLSIAATSPAGLIEMRTFYGGLMFAMGCFFALGAIKTSMTTAAAIMMTMTYFAAVLTRGFGLMVEPVDDAMIWNILYIEIIGFISGLAALMLSKSTK